MTIWFTSDPHFGHESIIRFATRPYKDAVEMDLDIMKRWNSKVSKTDTVYILGDVSMKQRYRKKIVPFLNGKKHLIVGNHDHSVDMSEGWESISHYK